MTSVDEKSQVQALVRTAPILLIRPWLPEKATRHPELAGRACDEGVGLERR